MFRRRLAAVGRHVQKEVQQEQYVTHNVVVVKNEVDIFIQVKSRARGVSLPRSAFRTATSSDESSQASPRTPNGPHDLPFPPFPNRRSRIVRDSIASSSSSLYPQSTSTESYPESSILQSLSGQEDASSFSPRIVTPGGNNDFDMDDVSYRLKLLVNNNYFLPPAHSKPSPLSLAPQVPLAAQKTTKAAAPGFLDFFRMGKSKSKPSTPVAQSPPAVDGSMPILRTTSDSTTASGYAPRSQPVTAPQASSSVPFPMSRSCPPPSRVVVLRERMDDLAAAAKQAERDIKLRSDPKKSLTSPGGNSFVDDVIDPTDAVDLPPPGAAYPFAVQASVLHGLGPGESVGAAVLADRLPPSPGLWSMSTEEESWRKAILQEAVSLSLSDSPDASFTSHTPTSPSSKSPQSFRSVSDEKPEEPASPPTPKATPLIGQRIIEPLKLDTEGDDTEALSPLSVLEPLPSMISPGKDQPASPDSPARPWRSSLNPPRRAETPAVTQPLTPPPPRRELVRPHHSMSSTDLSRPSTGHSQHSRSNDSLQILRKAVSSPRLSAVHDQGWNATTSAHDSIFQRISSVSPTTETNPRDHMSISTFPSVTSIMRASSFSDDDDLSYATPMDDIDDEPSSRPSMTLSIPTVGRPSMSDYSNPSPTASAFQDAVFGSCRSPSPLLFRRSHAGAIGAATPSAQTPAQAIPRHIAVSPPPRTSSSLGATVLPPPPRSPAIKPIYRPSISSGASGHSASASSLSSAPLYSATDFGSYAENDQHSTGTLIEPQHSPPLAERRGHTSPLSLLIPTETIPSAIHSAPAPASPTAFFDRIQSHPNAMDDLETSDESDDETAPSVMSTPSAKPETISSPEAKTCSIRSSTRSSTNSARPSIMRLGNHSTPHLSPSSGGESYSFDIPDPRKPIGHIPEKGTFFTTRSRKKSNKGQVPFPLPTYDSQTPAPDAPFAESSRQAGARARSMTRRPATASGAEQKTRPLQRESLQRFDGMLLEHMAAERDTIKRITSNLSNLRS